MLAYWINNITQKLISQINVLKSVATQRKHEAGELVSHQPGALMPVQPLAECHLQ